MDRASHFSWKTAMRLAMEAKESRRYDLAKQIVDTVMAFRTSKIYKALDKHDMTTPSTVKTLLAEGEDAEMTDSSTGRGYIHKIVEMFEAPQEDEFLESQIVPCLVNLVSKGANINLRDTDGNTPLHLAFILNSGPKIANMLIKLGGDMTILNESKQKVGDLITKNTDPHMVKLLGEMLPGLWHAVESEDHEKVLDLLEKWSKIDGTMDGKSLIDRAKELGNQDIITALQNYWPTNQFIYAAYTQDIKKMKKIMKKEQINVDVKDNSCMDDNGNFVDLTLLGECLMLNLFDSAQFMIEKGANINEPVGTEEEREPLYFFLMKNHPSLLFSNIFSTMLGKVELRLIKRFSVGVLYTAFTNSWPSETVDRMIEGGLDITHRSEEGYTLRDNILVQVAYYPRKKRLEKLHFVDQYVVKLVNEGQLDKLKEMAANGYMSLNIPDKKGKLTAYLAKKSGQKDVADWLENVGETFKHVNALHEYIKQANLSKAREFLNETTAKTKDRAGRSSLHIAVLFDRRFVVKYLIKEHPTLVHITDDVGRTPMHYACALPDGQDTEDLLAQAGADETLQDDLGRCPMDYKLNDDENFIESERNKTCSFNIYLLEIYISVADGIIADDFDLVRDTRDDLYETVRLVDVIPNMYKTADDAPPGFMQLCLDHKRENIARYLINNGVDMWEEVTYDGQRMPLPLAVENANMPRLNEFLAKKRREDEDDDKRFRQAEEMIKGSHGWADTRINVDDDIDKKSKSCVIL